MSDGELTLYAIREARVDPGRLAPSRVYRDCQKMITELLGVLDRDDVVEAVDRLDDMSGLRMSYWATKLERSHGGDFSSHLRR
ncbi:MAG: hypothetical protein JWL86_199 [Rhizobium sp.]|nr:hypothetical protein [Rhizobium sp.]